MRATFSVMNIRPNNILYQTLFVYCVSQTNVPQTTLQRNTTPLKRRHTQSVESESVARVSDQSSLSDARSHFEGNSVSIVTLPFNIASYFRAEHFNLPLSLPFGLASYLCVDQFNSPFIHWCGELFLCRPFNCPFVHHFWELFLCRTFNSPFFKAQGWTGMYILVVPSLSTKFIKNSHQNLPV